MAELAEGQLWSALFGSVLKDSLQKERDTDVVLGGIQIVGIYFANRRISRSPRFKPILKQFYDKVNKDGKRFEVVVASADKTEEDYLVSFPEKSQWYSLPFGSELVKKLEKQFEPPGGFALTIIQSDGVVIRDEGDGDIQRDKGGKRTFNKWVGDVTVAAPPTKDGPPDPEEEDGAAEDQAVEDPPPVNSDGQVLYWTAAGAEAILPWPLGRWKTMPVSDGMLSTAQVKFIANFKKLLKADSSPPEEIVAELQARTWVTAMAPAKEDAAPEDAAPSVVVGAEAT